MAPIRSRRMIPILQLLLSYYSNIDHMQCKLVQAQLSHAHIRILSHARYIHWPAQRYHDCYSLFVWLYMYICAYTCVCVCMHPSVLPSVPPSVYPSVHPSICWCRARIHALDSDTETNTHAETSTTDKERQVRTATNLGTRYVCMYVFMYICIYM